MKTIQDIKKLTTVGICFLLIATILTSLVVATNELVTTTTVIKTDLKVDPSTSYLTLMNVKYSGLTTCPLGDGPAYEYVKVTCRNANGTPLPGIKSELFDFTVTPAVETQYIGTLSCSFIPCALPSPAAPVVVATNSDGEIIFEVVGDTTIIGNISIQVNVSGILLNDIKNLSCKSFDINYDGNMDCLDFDLFSSDYRGESELVWRSDFDWNGFVTLSDFSMFAQHHVGPCEENHPPIVPRHPEPQNQSIDVPVDTVFGWTSGDPDENDTVHYILFLGTDPSFLIGNVVGKYPGNETEITWSPGVLLAFNTTYYWMVNATDSHGASQESRLWMFTTAGIPPALNHPPSQPANPSPADRATDVNLSPLLSVTVSDPDGDIMDVFFYNASDNLLIGTNTNISSGGIASVSWNGLQYGTLYQWYVLANDSLLSNTSAIWSFTTKNASGPSNPPTRRSRSNPSNQPPVADLSAGEPYAGKVGTEIIFNGSRSHDQDGRIVSWAWEFGDGTRGSGQQVAHTYSHAGIFTVSLVVLDNNGASGYDVSKVNIVKTNSPPSDPFILRLNGSEVVETLIRYFYTAQSNDADNDYLKYHFEWGDGTTAESIMLSGTPVVADHSWVSAGTYPVTVSAYDGEATASSSISVFVKEAPVGVAVEDIALVILALLASTLFLLLFASTRRKKDKKRKK